MIHLLKSKQPKNDVKSCRDRRQATVGGNTLCKDKCEGYDNHRDAMWRQFDEKSGQDIHSGTVARRGWGYSQSFLQGTNELSDAFITSE
jgi:hypothetical protein